MKRLSDFNQFSLVKITWDEVTQKFLKIPVNRHGATASALDPANWLSYEEASKIALLEGYRVGFVLTENDPFFCFDLDNCLMADGKSWSPQSYDVIEALPGCRVEVSVSGKGLHVWGSYKHLPDHTCKNVKEGFELYHKDRFIVLGLNPTGDESTDVTELLPDVISRWFPTERHEAIEWTTEPCAEWSGIEDDDELITKALESVNASSLFGSSLSFRNLWEADAAALGAVFEDPTREYDASSADSALALRLAFWTGKNCERMQRLMRRSALVRDKYDRPDYLPRTILHACSRQKIVYSASTKAQAEQAANTGGWVAASELPSHFAGCVYIEDRKKVMTPDGFLLDKEQFDVRYGGNVYVIDERKTERSAYKAFTQCSSWRRPLAHTTCFNPSKPLGALIESEGRIMCNTYIPCPVPAKEGDASPFTDLVKRMLPHDEDREVLMSYMAACVQHRGTKFTWCPILQGMQGNGKTLMGEILAFACGHRYSFVLNADTLKGGGGARFNAWIDRRVFICIEEIFVGKNQDMVERMKPLITNKRVSVEDKGVSIDMGENRANFLLLTNYVDAMPLTATDRRYAPLLTAQQREGDLQRDGLTNEYFCELFNWLDTKDGWEIVAHYLNTYPIAARYNPAGVCMRAPQTSGREQVIKATRGELEVAVIEACESGLAGFANGWLSSTMLERFIAERRLPALSNTRRLEMLDRLGYIKHPALARGRTPKVVSPDGVRATLYVKEGHLALELNDPHAVCARYERDQAAMASEIANFGQAAPAS